MPLTVRKLKDFLALVGPEYDDAPVTAYLDFRKNGKHAWDGDWQTKKDGDQNTFVLLLEATKK